MYLNAYPQNYLQNYPNIQQQNNNTQSGFIPVPSEAVARSYPVAYGASVSFKDENAPYIYTKTMGFSQLETPRFEKFRLVKEEAEPLKETVQESVDDNSSIEEVKALYEAIKADVDKVKKEVVKLKKELKSNIKESASEAAVLSEVDEDE